MNTATLDQSQNIFKLSPFAKSCQASDAPKLARVAWLGKVCRRYLFAVRVAHLVSRSNVAQMRFALFLPNVAARYRNRSTSRSLRTVNNSTHNQTQHFDKKHAQKETRLDGFVSLWGFGLCCCCCLVLLQ